MHAAELRTAVVCAHPQGGCGECSEYSESAVCTVVMTRQVLACHDWVEPVADAALPDDGQLLYHTYLCAS